MSGRTPELDTPRKWAGYWVQAALIYPLFWLVGLLPIDTASALGGWIGRTFGPRAGISRRARKNLRAAFPEKTDAEIETIVRGMWDNLGRTVFEYPHIKDFVFGDAQDRVEMVGAEHGIRLRDSGKCGIFFAGHLANWELAAMAGIRHNLILHLIYRAPNNPLVDKLFRSRHVAPEAMLPKGPEGAKRALKLLREGEHLGIIADQKMNDGIAVPFFGRDAMTAPALAMFALKFRCPVIPARVERLEGCRFKVHVYPPLKLPDTGDHKADVAATMGMVNAYLEDWIRQRPEQWIWLHNRWPD